ESTLELRRSGPGAALCIAVGDERRCALGQQGATSGDGPLLAVGADALWFATVTAGGSSWVLGTAGPAFGVEPSLQLPGRMVELTPIVDGSGRRWFVWQVDEAALQGQLPQLQLGEGPRVDLLALPR
ncbi:MAG: hypothetical protein AB7W59_20900, partial [Acidimicrobiia bacterium]